MSVTAGPAWAREAPKDARGIPLDLRAIEPLLEGIVSFWNPQEIWLFGSRARGLAAPDSDWDLLVVVLTISLRWDSTIR